MPRAGDIDFVESSIENARAQVTNVEKVTRTLESLHNEMHDFEDRIFFLEHDLGVPRCCGAFTPSMRLVSIREAAGWLIFRI